MSRRTSSRRAIEVLERHRSSHCEIRRKLDHAFEGTASTLVDAHVHPPEGADYRRAVAVAVPCRTVSSAANDPWLQHMLGTTAVVGATWQWWENGGRQIIRFDPDLVTALERTPDDVVVPRDPFAHLPFDSFAITFDEPIALSERQQCAALMIVRPPVLPAAHGNRTLAVSLEASTGSLGPEIPPLAGETPERLRHGETHLYLDDQVGGETLRASIDAMLDRVTSILHVDEQMALDEMRRVGRLAILAMLYLASTDPDFVTTEATPKARKKARRSGVPAPQVHLAGFRVGAALRAARSQADTGTATGSGRTVAPHMRRAHWHTVAFGPGRSMRRLKWFPPIAVNVSNSTTALGTTVRPAR